MRFEFEVFVTKSETYVIDADNLLEADDKLAEEVLASNHDFVDWDYVLVEPEKQ
jgi:hypothetical protein